MADHSEFLALAREIIADEGRSVQFIQLSATAADPNKPWAGAGTPTPVNPVNAIAVFLPDGSGLGKIIEDNELFKSSEQVLLVAPPITGEDLGTYHAVVEASGRWKINICRELKPADLTLLFAMGVSR